MQPRLMLWGRILALNNLKIKTLLLCLVGFVLISSCATKIQKSTVVLEYADFGPQAMAYRTLGSKNLQWQPNMPLLIGQGKVYVVVYRNIPLEDVMRQFPPNKDEHFDYRYIQYGEALNYLDARITQNILRNITLRLQQTRDTILQTLQ